MPWLGIYHQAWQPDKFDLQTYMVKVGANSPKLFSKL